VEQQYFQKSSWYYALPLTERITSLLSQNETPKKFDAQLAQRQMQRWRTQTPFTTGSYFAERLAIAGLTEDEFLQLLGESVEAVQGRFPNPPDWLRKIEQAFSDSNMIQSQAVLPLELTQGEELWGFLYILEPLICQGLDCLRQRVQILCQTQSNLPFDPETIEKVLIAKLPMRLFQIVNRTLVLELNVARLQGQLEGNTTQERFYSFIKRLRQREEALTLLQEYPVLARQAVTCIDQWVEFSLEFLQHLSTDWELIRTTFSIDHDLGLLLELEGNAGDSHRGGRSVLIAKFSSDFKIVYKPRSLAIDVHFQKLLTWLNNRGDHPPFRTLKVLDRSTYGWNEFVTAQTCNSIEEVQHFYQRQGGYLALLYALEATDFHSENLIAAGADPVLIDLETLFVPDCHKALTGQLEQPLDTLLFYSVMRTGLLPQWVWSNGESEGIDVSGLGGKEGQVDPLPSLILERVGTDEMRLISKRLEMSGSQNRPSLSSTEVNLWDYAEAIINGFTQVYQLILQHREELMSDSSPLASFAEDDVRVVLRGTRTYERLLRDSYHPDMLRNALERDRFFDRLWSDTQFNLNLKKIIAAEQEDLWRGDIPIFTTHPNSCHLWSSTKEQITNFCNESGLAKVHRRLQQLSQEDLERQLWFIKASLATLVINKDQGRQSSYLLIEQQHSVSREQLLAAAQRVGDRLESLALRDEKNVSWIGLTLINQKRWTLASLGIHLYDGLSGVILFLAYLGSVTKEKRYTTLAKTALTTMQLQVESSKAFITSIGGFSGWGGIIYTLTHLGILWDEPKLLESAESLVELLPDLIAKDEQLDIIGGAAGCIASLLNLYRCAPSQHTLAVAIQCGDRLIAHAQTMEHGIGWIAPGVGKKPLAGFSHGAAGIAWALLELEAMTSEERFAQVALEAIAYERSLLSLKVGNWPDLREFENTVLSESEGLVNFMTAWCHGAPGIGLGRLRSLPHLNNAEIRAEIDTALHTTLTQGFGLNHCLCHGDLGNLELLLQASLVLDDPKWHSAVNRLAAIVLESINQYGWLCGVPLGVETPGLMTGLAGIGYELLRLAEPTRIPSVLTLAPPTPFSKRSHA
jgi:type 2 lantibiotic biosynthesis protein LanM